VVELFNSKINLKEEEMNLAFNLKTPSLTDKEKQLHEKALVKSRNFKNAHSELLEIIMEVDKLRLFEKFCLTSTFTYCTQMLKLSEDVTYTLIKISRVSEKVPELKMAIDEGLLSISNAKRIASVVTSENKLEWIEKAKGLSQRKLEQEVAKVLPKEAVQEKMKYVSENRVKLETGLDEEVMRLIRRAQDLISQKSKEPATIEATLKEALTEYLERNDPVKKAERRADRKVKKIAAKEVSLNCTNTQSPVSRRVRARQSPRTTIEAEIIHQVNLRDQRKCQFPMPNGTKCESTRWIHYHHIIEVQHGGLNTLENLTTLCSQHHRQIHH